MCRKRFSSLLPTGITRGVLAEVSPVPYQELSEVLDSSVAEGKTLFVLILDRVTDVRNFGAIVRSAECAGVTAVVIPNKNSAKNNLRML